MRESIDLCEGNSPLTASDRSLLIARIHSLLNWCGERIPDHIVIGGKVVDLREIVFNYLTKDDHTEEEKRQADALANLLINEEQQLEEAIKAKDTGRQQACLLTHEARSLLRAVDELRSSTGIEAEIKKIVLMKKVEDAKRWHEFMKKVNE